jgi:membrane fusion protein, copper/silver efflux system
MKLARFVLILLAIGLIFVFGFGYGRWYSTRPAPKAGRKILYYVDAMHPWYKSDKPGIAPDCGMKLEPVYADGTMGTAGEAPARRIIRYRDPKGPTYTSDKPGLNPATGNELEPVYADQQAPAPGTIQISAEKQQLIGIRYGAAEWSTGGQAIRFAGRVVTDETRVTRVHAKVEGWIEQVSVDFTGQLIQKGQPLLTLYSPELLASEQELLLAVKAKDLMRHSSMMESADNSAALVEAARRRLELWDLSRSEIEEIERTARPIKSITLYSPAAGYVTARNAFPAQRVTPETELYAIMDLSHVWIMADVFEADAPQVRLGQSATILQPGTSRTLSARVAYLQPQIDPVTRTMKVRLDLANPGLRLKPDMFVDVEMQIGGGRRLTVPAEAVLDSGTTKTVFLDRGNGFFEPRQVETGQRIGDRLEIVKGLQPGERIVTAAAFLLNSESQMKSAMGAMSGMPGMNNDSSSPARERAPQDKGGMPGMPGARPDEMPQLKNGARK